jgi:3-oxoacyl-[acyl-carrier protein] reductase
MCKMTEEHFYQVIDGHLKGRWNGTRLAAASMPKQKSASILNISSLAGKVGIVGQTNHSAAKAGPRRLPQGGGRQGDGDHGVRVDAVLPGLIWSAMTEAMPQKAWG